MQFLSILDKYFKSYGNIMQFNHFLGSYQIWPCHVSQAKNLSFPYLKFYFLLNCRKSHQISWFWCIPNGSYKEDNLKEAESAPPPPCGIGLSYAIVYHSGTESWNSRKFLADQSIYRYGTTWLSLENSSLI